MKWLFCVVFALALVGAATAGEWHVETVDAEGWVGSYTSLALDSSDYPHISYYDYTNDYLKYARWDGDEWQIETVDSEGDVGRWTSLALDSSDLPHISYCDSTNYDLKYAHWNGGSWQLETVDSVGHVGWYTSLALDSSDRPRISYYDMTNYALKYARWNGSSWLTETVDTDEDVGEYSSLALDSSDNPRISYYYCSYDRIDAAFSIGELKYARWNGSSWQTETVDEEEYDVGMWTSLALDSSEYPHISYFEFANINLRYARWNGSSWQTETVESAGDVGKYTSLALDSSDYPRISYYDSSHGDLKYASWSGSIWWKAIVDSTGDVGWYTSLALDSSGSPHISYYDRSNGDLKYAWCESGPGVEGAELSAETRDEGILVHWTITGDIPSGLRVLRSVGNNEPVAIHDNPLPGSATSYLDKLDKGFQPLVQPLAGIEYRYWLDVTETDGTVSRFGPTEAVSIPEQTTRLALGEPYPSPARDAVTLTYDLPNGCSGAVIEVYDLSGRRLDSIPLTDSGEITLEVSDYASGVYTARLSTDEGSVSRRLVITR